MSLHHIKNRQQPTTFGGNLSVLIGDTTINGNVVVNGTINGISSGPQDSNNVWTGTNQFQQRPKCSIASVNNPDAVNATDLNNLLLSNSVINRNATWTQPNSFAQDLFVNENVNTVANNDAVTGKYLNTQMNNKYNSYLSGNNVWTGTNIFNNFIPTRNTNELSGLSAVTKQYVDTITRDLTIGSATSIASNSSLTNYNFGNQQLAHQIQIVGGGGGSGSSNTNSFGISGGSSSIATIMLLTYSPLATSLGISTNLGRFGIQMGIPGTGQTSSQNIAVDGTSSSLSSTSTLAYPSTAEILRTNGGKAAGNGAAVYSNINPSMVSPYNKCNGKAGIANGSEMYQVVGYNKFGAGARGGKNSNGSQGLPAGYTITSYKI